MLPLADGVALWKQLSRLWKGIRKPVDVETEEHTVSQVEQ
jgi:hypothetical protein